MNTGLHDNPEDRLDAFLDGTLEGDARRDMQARIAGDPALQHEAELQARIDTSLRRCCQAPDVERLLRRGAGLSKQVRSRSSLMQRIARMAAMVLIGVTVVLAVVWFAVPSGRHTNVPAYEVLGLEASYQKLVGDGFTPEWRCETDEEFASTYRSRLGQALTLGQLSAGTEALGLSYSPAFSYNTVALLVRVGGEPVVVYADLAQSVDGSAIAFVTPGVHVFQRRIGGLVLTEVTPWDRPAVLGAVTIPEGMPGCETDH